MRSRWGAALRLARRDALRHKARSLLVVLMVGLPVMLAVGIATVTSTADVDGREALTRTVGSSQAFVTSDGFDSPVDQDADGRTSSPVAETSTEPDRTYAQSGADLARRLDARVVPVRLGEALATGAARDGGSTPVTVLAADLADPATRGLVELGEGRLPRTDGEVVVTPSIARTGHEPGQRLTVGDTSLRVVGVGTTGPRFVAEDGVVVTPGAFDQVAPTRLGSLDGTASGYLVERDAPVTWQQVQELNRSGYVVTSREVVLDPPADADEVAGTYPSGGDSTLAALVVACIVIEVALLAGPAFAVGARSQRRHLALIAAGGGSPADLRRVVLAGALVLGGLAAVLGAVLGVALTPLAFVAAAPFVDTVRGPLDVPWGWAALAVVLGVVAAMVAAAVPAGQAARRDLVTALTERPDDPRPATGWPALGGVLVLVSLVLIFTGLPLGPDGSREMTVALGTVVLVVGVVFLVPLLIGGVGRVAHRLPLAPRIAVRDAARQRARSAPAVAAVMAVVAGITALGIGSASDHAQSARDYVYSLPGGQAKVSLSTFGGESVSAESFVARAARVLPDHRLVPVRSATNGVDVSSAWEVRPGTCSDSDCAWGDVSSGEDYASNGVLVADADELAAMGVRLDADARAALSSGRVLAPAASLAGADAVTLARSDFQPDGTATPGPSETVGAAAADLTVSAEVPAGHRTTVALAVVPPATADAVGIVAAPGAVVTDVRDGPLSDRDVDALGSLDLGGEPVAQMLQVERGFEKTFTFQFLALGVAGGLLVLMGTLTATGLALSDARGDLATLSAVGAAPRTRRAVAASQALVVGLLGSVLGLLVGFAPGWVAATALTAQGYGSTGESVHVLPWDLLALVVVGVPVLAAVVAGLAVRGRAVMVRRIA